MRTIVFYTPKERELLRNIIQLPTPKEKREAVDKFLHTYPNRSRKAISVQLSYMRKKTPVSVAKKSATFPIGAFTGNSGKIEIITISMDGNITITFK